MTRKSNGVRGAGAAPAGALSDFRSYVERMNYKSRVIRIDFALETQVLGKLAHILIVIGVY
jgi:hypothetical protein